MKITAMRLAGLAALGSGLLLGGAFIFQSLGYAPCQLCLWQRWPHGLAILAWLLLFVRPWRGFLWLGALAAAATSAIGLYHAGVEARWWPGPTSCTPAGGIGLSGDALFDQIMAAPVVRCDEIAWSFLGLSMAGWNFLLSAVLAALWIAAALRMSRR